MISVIFSRSALGFLELYDAPDDGLVIKNEIKLTKTKRMSRERASHIKNSGIRNNFL